MATGARIHAEERGRVTILTLSNPAKRNALNPSLLEQLADELERLARAPAQIVVLRGEGERVFSSGYDIGAIRGGAGEEASRHPLGRALEAIERFPFPIIAMVFGGAYGAACELVASCDLRFASDDARFAIPAGRLGVVYAAEGVARLARGASPALVRELLYTARPIDAPRALSLGLVQGLHPRAALEAEVLALAGEMAGLAPRTLSGAKRMLAALARRNQLTAAELEEFARLRDEALSSIDFAEGQAAFAAKRAPRFSGR